MPILENIGTAENPRFSESQCVEQGQRLRLENSLSGRDNNLNLIRMLAAASVLVSHAFPIALGEGASEPFEGLIGLSLGGLAVCIFFGVSGLLITRSFDRRKTLVRFVVARVLRLFPALLVLLAITVAAGAVVTSMPLRNYLTSLEAWTYIPRNMSLAFLQYRLPGVFEENPLPGDINGSLWTLFYEVVCYAAVVLAGLTGILRSRMVFSAIFAVLTLSFVASLGWEPASGLAYKVDRLAGLAWPFALGMMAYLWRDRIVLDLKLAIGLWLVCIPASFTPLWLPAVMLALLYSVAWIGFVPKGQLLKYNQLGDYSYGIYIFAFPIQQLLAERFGTVDPITNIAFALPLTVLLGMLSWHLIEDRALTKVEPLANWISAILPSPKK